LAAGCNKQLSNRKGVPNNINDLHEFSEQHE